MPDSPNDNSHGVVSLKISSNGSQIDDAIQIISLSVNYTINKIPQARIIIADGDMPNQDFPVSNQDDFKPGSEITIEAGYGGEQEAIFKGIVIKHGIKITGDNYSRLVIECRDKAVAMTVGRRNANYVDSKDSDIVSKLVGNYSGLSSDVQATNTEHKELVQYYCADWDFMLSRAEVNGLLVCVDDAKISVKPPDVSSSPVLQVTYGEDLIELHADIDARSQLKQVTSIAWNPSEQAVGQDDVATQTLNQQGDLTASDLAQVIGLESFRLQTPVPLENQELKDWASAQQTKAGLSRIRGRMKFQGSAKAKIGTLITLNGVGNRFKGDVFVSAVSHEIENGNWHTEVEFGMSPNWFVEENEVMAASASGLLPGVDGLQIGVVQKLDQDPDGQYKVQVSVPVLQAETEGVWARLANFYASDQFGAFFIPEIGDEVVLGYLNNDPSNPVILGSLYSSKRIPPYELTADNYTKAIVTKSKLKIELDDEKKIVTIITPAENKVVISDEGKSILLQDQTGNKLELSESGIVMDSPKDISISAQGKISLDAVGEIGIASQADVNVDGMNVNHNANVGFVAKGSASAELSASGQTTVKGAMVMIN
ncbi:MAG: type VI secretion system tip protein VgrG [Chromatiales bacterium]|jgi:Rhs element Vgr protein